MDDEGGGDDEFHFQVPPEAPVFRPTLDEFANPLTYISKIRPLAEKYGLCKIIPPASWQPPFSLDVDQMRFTPRVQRLNELEARTRVRLNFLDQIAKFWELQGSSLKIPMVERKPLDLYSLYRVVQDEGGLELASKERKWSKIAARLHYPAGKSVGTILRQHYERILFPFDVFMTNKQTEYSAGESAQPEGHVPEEDDEAEDGGGELEMETTHHNYKPHGLESRQSATAPVCPNARRSKRFTTAASTIASQSDTLYQRFKQFERQETKNKRRYDQKRQLDRTTRRRKRTTAQADPLAKYVCLVCSRGDSEESMLLCDGCDDSYHTFCLIPPIVEIPKGDWRCPKCTVEEVNKPVEAFGFEQAERAYSLQEFGKKADKFKAEYFNMPVHKVPTAQVEREFWRICSSPEEDVTVEYGADLHTMDHGSGFPTRTTQKLSAADQAYVDSNWNLNNLPLLDESILKHITADISGMKVPWMYVGMCFATFCWHNEDHWSYSVNYLHWGEAKTWYGVPGTKAEELERAMKSAAPELFETQPDLLHQLVTIMNPNILMNSGVPVYRTDQNSGEFVVTFPRAYHAGFNQGYNFAEAVNFAPADWLRIGRECVNHYSTLRRFCVFSHDELVCKMAMEPDSLNIGIATACYIDMAEMVDTEQKLRKTLLEWGVSDAEREAFELIPDDERQCDVCKTTCFLSAVTCNCGPSAVEMLCSSGSSSAECSPVKGDAPPLKEVRRICCLRHFKDVCKTCTPDQHKLRYRYTLNELPLMLRKLKVKVEGFEKWLNRVKETFEKSMVRKGTTTTQLNRRESTSSSASQQLKRKKSVEGACKRLKSGDELAERAVEKISFIELKELIAEADKNKYPNSRILEKLRAHLMEAEKCITVINHLLAGNTNWSNAELRTSGRIKELNKKEIVLEQNPSEESDFDLTTNKRLFVNKLLENERTTLLACGYLESFYACEGVLKVSEPSGAEDLNWQDLAVKKSTEDEERIVDLFTAEQKDELLSSLGSGTIVKGNETAEEIRDHIPDFEAMDELFHRLLNNPQSQHKEDQKEKPMKKLSEVELDLFVKEIENLFCTIPNAEKKIHLLQFQCKFFKQRISTLLDLHQQTFYTLKPVPQGLDRSEISSDMQSTDKYAVKWKDQRIVAKTTSSEDLSLVFYVKESEVDTKLFLFVYMQLLENLIRNEEFQKINYYIDNPSVKVLYLKYKQLKLLKKLCYVNSLTIGDLLRDVGTAEEDAEKQSGCEFFRQVASDWAEERRRVGQSSSDVQLCNFLADFFHLSPGRDIDSSRVDCQQLPLIFLLNKNFLKYYLFLKYKTMDEISDKALETELLSLYKCVQFIEQCDFNIKELLFNVPLVCGGDDENMAPKGRGRKIGGGVGAASAAVGGGVIAVGKRRRKNDEYVCDAETEEGAEDGSSSFRAFDEFKVWRINDLKAFVKNVVLKNFSYYLLDDCADSDSQSRSNGGRKDSRAGDNLSKGRDSDILAFVNEFLLLEKTESRNDSVSSEDTSEIVLIQELNDEVYGRPSGDEKKDAKRRRQQTKKFDREGGDGDTADAIEPDKCDMNGQLALLNNLLKRAVLHDKRIFGDEKDDQLFVRYSKVDDDFEEMWHELCNQSRNGDGRLKVKDEEGERAFRRKKPRGAERTGHEEFVKAIQNFARRLPAGTNRSHANEICQAIEQDETLFRDEILSDELYELEPGNRKVQLERTVRLPEKRLEGMQVMYNHFVLLKINLVRLNKLVFLIRKFETNQNYPFLINFITLFRFYREKLHWRIRIFEFERILRKNLVLAMEWLIKTFYIFLFNEFPLDETNRPDQKTQLKYGQRVSLGAKRGPKKAIQAADVGDKGAAVADSNISELSYMNHVTHTILSRDQHGVPGPRSSKSNCNDVLFLDKNIFTDVELDLAKNSSGALHEKGRAAQNGQDEGMSTPCSPRKSHCTDRELGNLLNHYLSNNELFGALAPFSFPVERVKYNLDNSVQPHLMVNEYKGAEQVELKAHNRLHFKPKANMTPADNVDTKGSSRKPKCRSCDLCSKRDRKNLFACNLCKKSYHLYCYQTQFPGQFNCLVQQYGYIKSVENAADGPTPISGDKKKREYFVMNMKKKLLCPNCLKTKRPRLEVILKLLVLLQKIPIRIPEGEALQCLTERAMNWQDRVRKFLKLNVFSEEVEGGGAGLSERIRNVIYAMSRNKRKFFAKTATNRGTLGTPVSANNNDSSSATESDEENASEERPRKRPSEASNDQLAGKTVIGLMPVHVAEDDELDVFMLENLSVFKERNFSKLASKSVRKTFLKLLIEGDLLEVSLDEQQLLASIWYLVYKKNGDLVSGQASEAAEGAGEDADENESDSEVTDSDLEISAESAEEVEDDEDEAKEDSSRLSLSAKKEKTKRKKPTDGDLVPESNLKQKRARRTNAANTAKGCPDDPGKGVRKRRAHSTEGNAEEDASDDDNNEEDDEEMCTAKKCLQPTGTEVDWVQCDACNKWFHMVCVGLLKVELKPDEDFVCKICSRKTPASTPAKDPPSTDSGPLAPTPLGQGKAKRATTRSL